MRTIFKKIKPILQFVIIALVIFFIVKVLWENWQELTKFNWKINWWFLILALLFHAGSFSLLGFSWNAILSEVCGMKLDTKKVWRIFFISQIIRYIPGKVWSFINLGIANKEKLGLRKTYTLLAIFIEITLRMAIGALISVIVLFEIFHQYSFFYYIVLFLTTFAAVTVIFNQNFLNKFLNWIFRKKGKNFISQTKFKLTTLMKLCGIFALHWLVFGIGLYFLIIALNINISIFKVVGIDILSWIVGYLSFLTPSGVGVREAVMIVLLTPYASIALATIISIFARLLFTMGELLNLGIVYLITKE